MEILKKYKMHFIILGIFLLVGISFFIFGKIVQKNEKKKLIESRYVIEQKIDNIEVAVLYDIIGKEFEEVRKYKKLADEKIISQEEFETKKKELLGL